MASTDQALAWQEDVPQLPWGGGGGQPEATQVLFKSLRWFSSSLSHLSISEQENQSVVSTGYLATRQQSF
jgi:hypothetical protein